MISAIGCVKAMYTQATNHLDAMLKACNGAEERDQIWAEYYALRANFDNCVNQKFAEDDPELTQLELDAEASAQQIAKIGDQLNDIVKVLATLSTAVSYGVKIAAKVIAV